MGTDLIIAVAPMTLDEFMRVFGVLCAQLAPQTNPAIGPGEQSDVSAAAVHGSGGVAKRQTRCAVNALPERASQVRVLPPPPIVTASAAGNRPARKTGFRGLAGHTGHAAKVSTMASRWKGGGRHHERGRDDEHTR